ncbi:MAG: hypothetical protein PUE46_08145 [Eubacteriales bacterium]|nr:hypothetical protein [Eubacteriales bacterium]
MGRTMILYHGSNIANIKILEPKQADHDRPYVYMTTLEIVSSFYLCNAVERPYYWFPYGFTKENIPIYHELYPNALKEVSDGVSGYIYKVEADESQVIPFKNIPTARLATKPIEVTGEKKIDNSYDYFLECESKGLLKIGRFEDKSEKALENWYNMIYEYIKEKNMIATPKCSYAKFVQDKFPQVWDKCLKEELNNE